MAKTVQTIRGQNLRVIGTIETDEHGVKTVRDFYRRVLGHYYPDKDITKDFYGRIVAHGDASAMLLNQEQK